MRYTKLHYRLETANWILLLSSGGIYLANLFLRFYLWESTALAVLMEVACPLLFACAVYEFDWRTGWISNTFMSPSNHPLLESVLETCIAILLLMIPSRGVVHHIIPILLLARICYAWGGRTSGHYAIVSSGIFLLMISAHFQKSIVDYVSLATATISLLLAYPSLGRLYQEAAHPKAQLISLWDFSILAIVYFLLFAIMKMFSTNFPISPNIYTVILTHMGWIPFLFIIFLTVVILLAAGYRCFHEFRRQKLIASMNFSLMLTYATSHILVICGYNICPQLPPPLLGCNGWANFLYIVGIFSILKVKQKNRKKDDQ